MVEFAAYGEHFKFRPGLKVKAILDVVENATGRRGRFRQVSDGTDLSLEDSLIETEEYEFIEDRRGNLACD